MYLLTHKHSLYTMFSHVYVLHLFQISMPCSYGSSGITIKPKTTKQNFCHDHVNPNLHSIKIIPPENLDIFWKFIMTFHFRNLKEMVKLLLWPHKLAYQPYYYYTSQEIGKLNTGVTSSGITLLTKFHKRPLFGSKFKI